jgi:uncharacterized protein YkwD
LARLTPIPTSFVRRSLSVVCAAVCVVAVSTSTAKGAGGRIDGLLASRSACPTGYLHDAPVSVQLGAMVCLIQFVRAREGLKPLRRSSKLDQVAGLKVDADLACDEFSHTPCGKAFMTWFEAVGYGLGSDQYVVGENLAWGSGRNASPRRIMRMWLLSAEHRRNLVSPKWREFGLGLRPQVAFLGSDRVELWANEFGSP